MKADTVGGAGRDKGDKNRRLVVGITGASGVTLGIRLLELLRDTDIETHLVISASGRINIEQETDLKISDVFDLADFHYKDQDIGAAIASGSFSTMGMIIIPCSIKTLSAVANSYAGDLIVRAADVSLKEGRPLVLVVREAPLHRGHLRLMDLAAQAGAVIYPPLPAFYAHPQSLEDVIDNIIGRVLVRMGIENPWFQEWKGIG